jgi:hypothetical protein
MMQRGSQQWTRLFAWMCLLMVLAACQSPPAATPRPIQLETITPSPTAGQAPQPDVTPRALPTIYPTETPGPIPTATATQEAAFAEASPTQPPLDSTSLSFRIEIPVLGLERSLVGTVGGQITMVDIATGEETSRANQGSILLEMITVLDGLDLDPMPPDCQTCVHFEYELPLSDVSESGWLREVQVLASVDNYLTAHLGPHFPSGAVVGLRRSASSYDVAQTIAVDIDGGMWRWLASSDRVSEQEASNIDVVTLFETLTGTQISTVYEAACPGSPVETLVLGASGDRREIRLRCPELVLPGVLAPLYAGLAGQLAGLESEAQLPAPDYGLPVDGLLYYEDAGEQSLTISLAGLALLEHPVSGTISFTLPITQVITATSQLAAAPGMVPGGAPLIAHLFPALAPELEVASYDNVLAVRQADGVYSIGWIGPMLPIELMPAWNALISILPEEGQTLLRSTAVTGTEPITGTLPLTGTVPLTETVPVTSTVPITDTE